MQNGELVLLVRVLNDGVRELVCVRRVLACAFARWKQADDGADERRREECVFAIRFEARI
jgi:hypothetical protein